MEGEARQRSQSVVGRTIRRGRDDLASSAAEGVARRVPEESAVTQQLVGHEEADHQTAPPGDEVPRHAEQPWAEPLLALEPHPFKVLGEVADAAEVRVLVLVAEGHTDMPP